MRERKTVGTAIAADNSAEFNIGPLETYGGGNRAVEATAAAGKAELNRDGLSFISRFGRVQLCILYAIQSSEFIIRRFVRSAIENRF